MSLQFLTDQSSNNPLGNDLSICQITYRFIHHTT